MKKKKKENVYEKRWKIFVAILKITSKVIGEKIE